MLSGPQLTGSFIEDCYTLTADTLADAKQFMTKHPTVDATILERQPLTGTKQSNYGTTDIEKAKAEAQFHKDLNTTSWFDSALNFFMPVAPSFTTQQPALNKTKLQTTSQ